MIEGLGQAYVYQEADRLTLIDTGLADKARAVLDAIAAAGRTPKDLHQIILTHYHADHAGSAAELRERTGAPVLAHALDAPVVRGEQPEPRPVFESELERHYGEQVSKDVLPAVPCAVDRELTDGDAIDVDGGARIVHAPGHTAGSVAVYLPKRRLLFLGDAAARLPEGRLLVGVFNVDSDEARRSFQRLAELDFEVACFGHGAPLDKEASLAFRRLAEKL
jgi:glyoxylase-like metal-dependent hydrolase (beta-lactamase superfamily II)